jgi:acetate kinase
MDKGRTSCHILCMNSGSSSLKFALYRVDEEQESLLAQGAVERIGLEEGLLWVGATKAKSPHEVHRHFPQHKAAVHETFGALERLHLPTPDAVGHRVVHGGPHHSAPARVDPKLLQTLRGLIPFAPLHLPSEILCIEAVAERLPQLIQVACFDTAFHRRMPELAQRFPLPRHLWDEGLRRYGFHGLSYEYIVETLGDAARGRVIIAHLGNGASMAAVRDGQPLDTTMGFTPAGGFMMGTRSGDLDPGIIIHLMNEKGYDCQRIDDLVNREAGLLGVSGTSPDMKTLLEQRERKPHAEQAIWMFCYQLRKQIGSFAAALGGLDTLVFTGGIGERAAPVRWSVCQGLEHLGIRVDSQRNETHADVISLPDSACVVRVIPTNEDLIIARHTRRFIG